MNLRKYIRKIWLKYTKINIERNVAEDENSLIHMANGKVHNINTNQPAIITYYSDNTISSKSYYINGLVHRLDKDGPAEITYDESGNITGQCYIANDNLHNVNGPARIEYFNNKIISTSYCINGFNHKLNGPATIYYTRDVKICIQLNWYVKGKKHNIDRTKPSGIYITDGVITYMSWFNNGAFTSDVGNPPRLARH